MVMTDIEWACKWVGNGWSPLDPLWASSDSPLIAENTEDGYLKTMADLAEAVRITWWVTDSRPELDVETEMNRLGAIRMEHGDEAFIAAVREAMGKE